ncbi:MAG: carboxypeptidase-like regulatory domain-containing protein, partial [Flammeovirgaceae bacterium]|nr:carboxypeptidase-like regulatory domain-containing protein [Flammeovirgaceae bacterium]
MLLKNAKKGTIWLLLLSFLGIAPLKAQCTFSLDGIVVDVKTGETVAGAVVFCEAIKKGEVCNEKGHFHFKDLCPGKYRLLVSVVGYEKIDTTLYVPSQEQPILALQPFTQSLDEVQIIAEKHPNSLLPQYSLKNPDIHSGKLLAESLRMFTGVDVLKTGNSIGKPVVHGLHSQRLLILNNGVRQEGQQWGNEHAPEIDAFLASNLTLIKGAASVQYGSDALGGVILAEPPPLPYEEKKIGGHFHMLGESNGRLGATSAVVEGTLSRTKWAWRVQGTFKRSGNIRTPHYYLMNTGAKEHNFSAAFGVRKQKYGIEAFYSQFNTDIGIFRGAHIGNLQDLMNAIASNRPLYQDGFTYRIGRPKQEVQHQLAKTTFFWRFNEHFKLSWISALQQNHRAEYDAHRAFNTPTERPQMQLLLQTATTDVFLEHAAREHWSGKVGVSLFA